MANAPSRSVFNATDEYATFVEDCRLGRIEYSDGRRMRFTKIDGDFAMPVFNLGTAGCVIDPAAIAASKQDGELRGEQRTIHHPHHWYRDCR